MLMVGMSEGEKGPLEVLASAIQGSGIVVTYCFHLELIGQN